MKAFRNLTHLEEYIYPNRTFGSGNTLCQSCGAHSTLLDVPTGIGLVVSKNELPTIEKEPVVKHPRYSISQRSVKVGEEQYITYRTVHCHNPEAEVTWPDDYKPVSYEPVDNHAHPVIGCYWASLETAFKYGMSRNYTSKPDPAQSEAMRDDVVDYLKDKVSFWVLRSGERASVRQDLMFKEKLLSSELELLHESSLFNNRTHNYGNDTLSLLILKGKA